MPRTAHWSAETSVVVNGSPSPVLQRYLGVVEFVVCPVDGVQLKTDLQRRATGEPLVLRCPSCGRSFTMDGHGLRPLPENPSGD